MWLFVHLSSPLQSVVWLFVRLSFLIFLFQDGVDSSLAEEEEEEEDSDLDPS